LLRFVQPDYDLATAGPARGQNGALLYTGDMLPIRFLVNRLAYQFPPGPPDVDVTSGDYLLLLALLVGGVNMALLGTDLFATAGLGETGLRFQHQLV